MTDTFPEAFDPERRLAGSVAISFCCIVAMLDGADAQALAIAAPLMARDLQFGSGALGLVFSASLAGSALGALIAGVLSGRFGAKRVLVACTTIIGVLQLATAHAGSLQSLILLRIVAGLGLGGAGPTFLALAADHTPSTYRARMLGLVWACFPLGALLGGAINGRVAQNWSWQDVFVIGGVPALMVAVLIAVLVRDAPRPPRPARQAAGLTVIFGDPTLRRPMLLLACIFFATFAILAEIVAWVPTILAAGGMPTSLGGAALSVHALGALASLAGGGYLLDRLGIRMLVGAELLSIAGLVGLSLVLSGFWPVALFMMVLGVSLGFAAAGAIGLCGLLFPEQGRSTGLGIGMAAAQFGQMVILLAFGLLLQHGIPARAAFQGSAVILLAATLAALALDRSTARDVERRTAPVRSDTSRGSSASTPG